MRYALPMLLMLAAVACGGAEPVPMPAVVPTAVPVAVPTATSVVVAVPPTQGGPAATVSDCFGGVLAEDPLHCHVLQEAHNTGIIQVEAIYGLTRSLIIYLVQDEPVSNETYRKLWALAQEDVKANAGRNYEHNCVHQDSACNAGVLWLDDVGYVLPETESYLDLDLVPGGAEERKEYPGWQALRQLWPEALREEGPPRSAESATIFDISDVDTKNIPPVDCYIGFNMIGHDRSEAEGRVIDEGSCVRVQENPQLNSVGWYSESTILLDDRKIYVEYQVPAEDQDAIVEAQRKVIAVNPRGFSEENIVIVPSPYGYDDLWRSFIVLNRFVRSSGNTIGITAAYLDSTYPHRWDSNPRRVYPLPHIQEPGRYESEPTSYDRGDFRQTVKVFTLDVDRTVEALPVLLPQLGLRADTVSVVLEHTRNSFVRGSLERTEGSATAAPSEPVEGLPAEPEATIP